MSRASAWTAMAQQQQQRAVPPLPEDFPLPGPVTKGALSTHPYQDEVSSYMLSVRIIRARNLRNADVFSKPDCYVSLYLPTSSSEKKQTKTIWNSKSPVWDETFQFRIVKDVMNVLELSVYDQDTATKDDHLFTLSIDLAQVSPEEPIHKTFAINPQGMEELDVEFKMTRIPESSEKILTNGVIVAREVSCLEVEVDTNPENVKEKKELMLTVKGSYEESHKALMKSPSDSHSKETFLFHSIRGLERELTASLKKPTSRFDVTFRGSSSDCPIGSVTPVNTLPVGQDVKVKLEATKKEHVDLQLKLNECPEDLSVRLGFDLCEQEKQFLQKRKTVVAAALRNILHLEEDLKDHEIPVVAVTATGGGIRAMTSMYSHLSMLQKMGLLDCVMYITGASGSTWAMSKLYEDADWSSKDLTAPIDKALKDVMKSKRNAFTWERLKYYRSELAQKSEEGHNISFTDLWGLILESMFHSGRTESKLSDQQKALERGQNPLPLYLAMNVKPGENSTTDFKEWCEFSPYEVGLLKYGAFIRSELFGSEFFMGRLMKMHPEQRICFLQGLWGNIYSVNLMDTWYIATNSDHFWDQWFRNRGQEIDKDTVQTKRKTPRLKTHMHTPPGMLSNTLKDILTNRFIDGEQHNFLRGFQMHRDYSDHSQFSTWKDCPLDSCPNQLTPSAERLCLVDAAYYINASYPSLLKAERKVDVILSFDYSLNTPLQSVEQTEKYCTEQGIAFPKIVLSDEEKKSTKECYTFTDTENPNAPTVLHFPLVNDTFKEFKAPGIRRTSAELADGNIDVSSYWTPYYLTNFTYNKREYDQLLKLTEYNLLNNKDQIVKALRTAVERRKSKQS
ncbi:cytosolic phospholipase A2 delta-like [Lissotriton helveticus]